MRERWKWEGRWSSVGDAQAPKVDMVIDAETIDEIYDRLMQRDRGGARAEIERSVAASDEVRQVIFDAFAGIVRPGRGPAG